MKADITPTEIVRDFNQECASYEKYRKEFKPVYNQMLSNVGFDETDWTQKVQKDLRCTVIHQTLREISSMSGSEKFIADVNPILEAAIAVEKDYYQQMKKLLQIVFDFYNNSFEAAKKEIAELAPVLEQLQKTRPTDPEKIQYMDKVTNRFTELQRMLKRMVQPGTESIQQSHLKALREIIELFGKMHEQLAVALGPLEKMAIQKPLPRSASKMSQLKSKKLDEDNRDN